MMADFSRTMPSCLKKEKSINLEFYIISSNIPQTKDEIKTFCNN